MVEVGQIVEVRNDLEVGRDYGNVCIPTGMRTTFGKILVVSKIREPGWFELKNKDYNDTYIFTESMLTDRKFKFKIGDEVKATKGQGEIVDYKLTDSGNDYYLVKGLDYGHDGNGSGILGYWSDKSDCWWFNTSYISLSKSDNKPIDVSKQIKATLIGHKDSEDNPSQFIGCTSFMIPQVAEKNIIEEAIDKYTTDIIRRSLTSNGQTFLMPTGAWKTETLKQEKSSLHSKRRAYVRSKIRVEA